VSPVEYLRALRLHRAAHRLRNRPPRDVLRRVARRLRSMSVPAGSSERGARGPVAGEFRREQLATREPRAEQPYDPSGGAGRQPEIELFGPLNGICASGRPASRSSKYARNLMSSCPRAARPAAFSSARRAPAARMDRCAGAIPRDFRCIWVTDAIRGRRPLPPLDRGRWPSTASRASTTTVR